MELDNAPGPQVWAYRQNAWAIDELEQRVGLLYRGMGRTGLEHMPSVGSWLAELIEAPGQASARGP